MAFAIQHSQQVTSVLSVSFNYCSGPLYADFLCNFDKNYSSDNNLEGQGKSCTQDDCSCTIKLAYCVFKGKKKTSTS